MDAQVTPTEESVDPVRPTYTGFSLKKNDAEALTREDIQYDLLECVFSDQQACWTDQSHLYGGAATPPTPNKITFRELYTTAILHSSKLSGVLKERMQASEAFAVEYAKIALLVNIGRINTTMAFFPDMKTSLRTYHPIPSLQKSECNVQDAPRIKNALKGAYLPFEAKAPGDRPTNPAEVLTRWNNGQRPPCSITNLIFILSTNSSDLGAEHFDRDMHGFTDLFLTSPFTSASRARVFLWIVWYYLEGATTPNPYAEAQGAANPKRPPKLVQVDDAERAQGINVDTPEELEWYEHKKAQRFAFLKELVRNEERDKRGKVLPDVLEIAATPSHLSVPGPSRRRKQKTSREPSVVQGSRPEKPYQPRQPRAAPSVADPPPPAHYYHRAPEPLVHNVYIAERTPLQHAWTTSFRDDPLVVSDGEDNDLYVRRDFEHRLSVLNRLRGVSGRPQDVYVEQPRADV